MHYYSVIRQEAMNSEIKPAAIFPSERNYDVDTQRRGPSKSHSQCTPSPFYLFLVRPVDKPQGTDRAIPISKGPREKAIRAPIKCQTRIKALRPVA